MIMPTEIPVIKVGIFSGSEIRFELNSNYSDREKNGYSGGVFNARKQEGKIVLENNGRKLFVKSGIFLQPENRAMASFRMFDVTIGIDFHWQKKEDEVFRGGLKLIVTTTGITAINVIPVEDYLISVISSEMSATSSVEMLKAHAVISRSWLLAQIEKGRDLREQDSKYLSAYRDNDEIIRWYDREDHADFDVCADDHCQRYQGITRASTPIVENAVKQTAGEVLTHGGRLCDTRFSKCCGGVTELFENTWEPVNHPYLQRVYDNADKFSGATTDLTVEYAAKTWILSNPPAFCNTHDKRVLSQVLNDYDQTTLDFYRWKVSFSAEELGELIKSRTGIDFGTIMDLIPVQRGISGRIIKLKIVGSEKTMTIGKELEIRKALSKTHLYSSAFVVEKVYTEGACHFILHGAGWGHGVGLCQIGAAMMGAKGYSYKEILLHYFRGAALEKKY
jgi:stage II sporulation protein D